MGERWDAYLAVALDGDDIEIQVDGHAGDIAQIAAMALADVIVQSSPEKERAIKMLDDMKNQLDGIITEIGDMDSPARRKGNRYCASDGKAEREHEHRVLR